MGNAQIQSVKNEKIIITPKYLPDYDTLLTVQRQFDDIVEKLPTLPLKPLEIPVRVIDLPKITPKHKSPKKHKKTKKKLSKPIDNKPLPLKHITLPALEIVSKKQEHRSLLSYTGEKLQLLSLSNIIGFIPRFGKPIKAFMLWSNIDIRCGFSYRNSGQSRAELELKVPSWCSGIFAYLTDKPQLFYTSLSSLLLQDKSVSPQNTRKCVKIKWSNSIPYMWNWLRGKAKSEDSKYQIGLSVDSEMIKTSKYRMTWTNGVEMSCKDNSRTYYSGIKNYIKPLDCLPEIEINAKVPIWSEPKDSSNLPSIF